MELKPTDHHNVAAAVAKSIDARIDLAIKALSHRRDGNVSDAAIHESRKQFKQVRAALKLLRKPVGRKLVREANRTFRDAGRPLSAVRDAKVLIDTLDALAAHFKRRVKGHGFAPLRRALLRRRRDVRRQVLGTDRAARRVLSTLRTARAGLKRWDCDGGDWGLLARGLKRSYRAGRRAMKVAWDGADDDTAMHECRKRAKDLRYQLEMLVGLWPAVVKPIVKQAHDLTDLLGVDHDLAVLRSFAANDFHDTLAADDAELLLALIDERRLTLQRQARQLAQKLFAERPRAFVERFEVYWTSDESAPSPSSPR